jgi:hydroxyethylthiazole kinase-like uncharacterized protein yjeF
MRDPIQADLLIDGLFGGGFRSGLPPAIEKWARSESRVLAVDVPSGLDPDTGEADDVTFRAERTVTFDYLKTGHLLNDGPDFSGIVSVAPIGLGAAEPAMFLTEALDAILPQRSRRVHKWSAGSVLVIGGSLGMTGAATMAGKAALAFGAGAVGVAVPEESTATATAQAPELLHFRLDSLPERFDTLVIGPGLGHEHDDLARKLVESWDGPVVVDADALTSVSERHRGRLVLTPHAGEFARMTASAATPAGAAELAQALGAVVVLKGNPTIVTDGALPWIVNSGGAELATIGTGDVLAGMTGALLAAGLEPLTAARSAAYWHGVAGASLARVGTVTSLGLITEVGRWR